MLGFGIFTSFVPYLVMLILYMTYFLFASFSGIKAKGDLAFSDEGNGIIVDSFSHENAFNDSKDVKNYIVTNSDFSDDEVSAFMSGNIASLPENIIFSIVPDEKRAIISPYFLSCLFTRPPPHC